LKRPHFEAKRAGKGASVRPKTEISYTTPSEKAKRRGKGEVREARSRLDVSKAEKKR